MADKADEFLRFISRIQRLEAFPRSGWIVSGVVQPENVAAHTYEVAITAMWLAEQVEEAVDMARLLQIALLHDVGESITMDLPRPVKSLMGPAIKDAESKAVDIVLEHAPEYWRDRVREYDAAESIEARIVKAADTIQMLARALLYESQGRGEMERFWTKRSFSDYGIEPAREILRLLRERHENGQWFAADFD